MIEHEKIKRWGVDRLTKEVCGVHKGCKGVSQINTFGNGGWEITIVDNKGVG